MTRRPPRSTLFPYPTLFRSHWFEFDPPVLAHPGRDVLQTLERLQGEGAKPPSPPPRFRRPPTARRYAELGFDVRKKLHRAEITARRGNFTPPLGPEPLSDPIHVELSLHRLLLGRHRRRQESCRARRLLQEDGSRRSPRRGRLGGRQRVRRHPGLRRGDHARHSDDTMREVQRVEVVAVQGSNLVPTESESAT